MDQLDGFDQYIKEAMVSWHVPGMAVAIVQGDDVLYQTVHGLRDVEENLPMTVDTRFAMASVTKSFTAMSAALLVDDGKIEWDKPVRDYIPEFILHDEYVTKNITVRDMLSHRTGLPRHDFAAWRLELSRAEFIKRMKHLKFNATFREKFQYNNLMYMATAYLVERVSGIKWEDFVQQRIFDPLGMTASNFVPESPQPKQITSQGYRIDRDEEGGAKGWIRMGYGKHTELSPSSAGALFSSLADLIQWLKVHVNGGVVGGARLISPDNLKQMHLPQTVIPGGGINEALHGNTIFTYGMGWFVEPHRGYTLVQHGGNVEGFSLIIGFVPGANIGVVGLTNVQGMPLRDVILYEGVGRALGLPSVDWNTKYHQLFDPVIIGQAKGKQTAAGERVEGAPPTHPIETYVGTYEADGYPDFGVRLVDGGLQAATIGSLDWSELRHYHYNVFEWHLADFDEWAKVTFLVSENGEVDAIAVPIEEAVENVVFKRKALELPDGVRGALLGVYTTDIAGLAFTITARDGKYYVTATGNAAEEIKPYKLEAGLVGFRSKRERYDFMIEDGAIDRMEFKLPGFTLAGKRVE